MASNEAQASADHLAKAPERKSLLTRDGSYRKTCEDNSLGFTGPNKPDGNRWEAHHILCDHAVGSRDTTPYVEDCLWSTDWNLNDKHNLIGLPRNREFRQDGTARADKWVSHQVDHNTQGGYTDECKDWLQNNIFNSLAEKAEEEDHSLEVEDIRSDLRTGSDIFRGLLKARAERPPGIVEGWKNRFEEEYQKSWYLPFSMGQNPRHRSPGVDLNDKSRNVFKLLD